MKNNKNASYGRFYRVLNKNKGLIAGIIGGLLALVMIIGTVASAFL